MSNRVKATQLLSIEQKVSLDLCRSLRVHSQQSEECCTRLSRSRFALVFG